MPPKIRFVVATRESKDAFLARTATGRSLALYSLPFVELWLRERNREGLPSHYNRALDAARSDPSIIVFAHDDLHFSDFFWFDRIAKGLEHFDIIGAAGNRRRLPRQPSWAFVDFPFTWDDAANLSGMVGHGNGFPPADLTYYGPSGQEVKLLDGMLLAAHSETLNGKGIRFDERFDFHFYDMDLCRQAEANGLRMGTWHLSLIHESPGHFGSEAWHGGYRRYLDKWGE